MLLMALNGNEPIDSLLAPVFQLHQKKKKIILYDDKTLQAGHLSVAQELGCVSVK